jgi:DNA-binding transcriptional LysR family regulator
VDRYFSRGSTCIQSSIPALVPGAGFRPRIAAQPQRITAILAMVGVGEGIGLLANATVQRYQGSSEVCFKKLLSPDALLIHAFASRQGDTSALVGDLLALISKPVEMPKTIRR